MQNNIFSGLFVGQNIIDLQRVDSTNNYIKNELAKARPLPEGTVIMAEEQYAGRGQFSNQWLSEPGKNLTFSLLLAPSFLSPSLQFRLNIAISIAINDVLAEIIGQRCKIKWPNDLFFGDQKLGGILIENILTGRQWKYAVIGIGINVNQTDFPQTIKNVTSIKKITGRSSDLRQLLGRILKVIEERYIQLKEDRSAKQYEEYLAALYRFNETGRFKTGETEQTGRIVGVEPDGRLQFETGGTVHRFSVKEIEYLYP